MVESSALLVDEVLPQQPMRQWVLSVPIPLRFLFACQPNTMGKALRIVYRAIAAHLSHKAGYKKSKAHTGAVTLNRRFGSALNLSIHFHMLFLDGVNVGEATSSALKASTDPSPPSTVSGLIKGNGWDRTAAQTNCG